jgi:hypothetical protein
MTLSHPCRLITWPSLVAFSVLVVAALGGISASSVVDFRAYFGSLPPAAAATVVCAMGIPALYLLQKYFFFCVIGTDIGARSLLMSIVAAVPFMATVTLADLFLGFPAGIHVELPVALVFYPAMGFVAQLSLHIVPFALLLMGLTWRFASWPFRRRVWIAIISSASLEAVFQLSVSSAPGDGLQVLGIFVAVQLFVFGLVELYLFRRFDFVTMYLFRLAYYGYWHLLWGNCIRPSL